jgi:hypothetical protein
MSESFKDQLSRVQMMADGSPTWDLSDNDTAALTALLKSHEEILEALQNCVNGLGCQPGYVNGLALSRAKIAIAQALGAK